MTAKKAKGKAKATAKKSAAKKSSPKEKKKGKDIVEVRENINELVKESAEDIATSVIEVATRTGQLASAKYLFEAVGIYPATEQPEARPIETTMAHQLLTRMGLPLEPVVYEKDGETVGLEDEAEGVSASRSLNVPAETPDAQATQSESVPCEGDE